MFFLHQENNEDNSYVLYKNGTYTIGRSKGDIVIKHSSISRKHAEIRIDNDEVFINDTNSKFFTRYKGKILPSNEDTKLEGEGELILGEVQLKFRVEGKIVTCSTALKVRKEELISIMREMNGTYVEDWNDSCTHLTTNEIIITLKVLYALMDNRKIVTFNYWTTYLQNIKNNKLPPDPSQYFPPLGETVISVKYIAYNPNRKHLFKNKTFAFWVKKRQSKMDEVIKKAGGESVVLNKNLPKNELLKLLDKYIVIEPENPKLENELSDIFETYKNNGKRLIPVQEIVIAILQCSCEDNCNPSFNRVATVFSKNTEKMPESAKTVVNETQSQQINMESQPERIIPPTLEENLEDIIERHKNPFNTSKKTMRIDDAGPSSAKRIKLDTTRMSETVTTLTERLSINPNETTDLSITHLRGEDVVIEDPRPFTSKRRSNDEPSSSMKRFKEDRPCLKRNPFANVKIEPREKFSSSISEDKNDSRTSKNVFGKLDTFIQTNVKHEPAEEIVIIDDQPKKQAQPKQKEKYIIRNDSIKTEIDLEENMINKISFGSWLSTDIGEDSKTNITLDDEERLWCEKFNNTAVIKVQDLITKTDYNDISMEATSTNSSGVKNFKKFRKVPIPKSNYVVQCRLSLDPCNITGDYGKSDDEDNREI